MAIISLKGLKGMVKYRVLLVDDESYIRARLSRLIQDSELPFDVAGEAGSGVEALQMMERIHPQVIFTDIRMPQMDGLAFIKEIRLLYPDIFISILTGFDRFEYAYQALRSKVNEFLVKPVSESVLKDVLSRAELELRQLSIQKTSQEQLIQSTIDRCLSDILEKGNDSQELERQLEAVGFRLQDGNYRLIVANRTLAEPNIFLGEIGFTGPHNLPVWLVRRLPSSSANWPEQTHFGTSRVFNLRQGRFELLVPAYGQAIQSLNRKWFNNVSFLEADLFQSGELSEAIQIQYGWMKKIMQNTEEGQPAQAYMLIEELFQRIEREQKLELSLLQQLVQEFHDRLLFIGGNPVLADKETPLSWIMACGSIPELKEKVRTIVALLSKHLERQREQVNPFIHKALTYIHQHFNEELTLAQISGYVALNPNYFCGLFKSVTGKSFKHYMTDYRIKMAKELLLEGSWKPTEVSFMVGYADEKYFSRVFKKVTGYQPHTFGKSGKATP
jgi:two-component system response regulator YesN